jgi:hypothetical protein
VPDLEKLEILGDEQPAPRPAQLTRWLAAALAVALVAVAGLAGWIWWDHRDTRSDTEKAAAAAVLAWDDGFNAHDLQAMHRVMTSDCGVTFIDSVGSVDGPYQGLSGDVGAQSLFSRGAHVTVLQGPVVGASLEVWVLVRMTELEDQPQIGHQVFQLAREDGQLLISAVTWVHAPVATATTSA